MITVVHVIDDYSLVINQGSAEGISLLDTFLVYGTGPELTDPISGNSLGVLEIVRGRARVRHIQEHMTTIESSESRFGPKTVRKFNNSLGLLGMGPTTEEQPPQPIMLPFEDPKVGDFARRFGAAVGAKAW